MITTRAVASSLRCHGCRSSIVRSFISSVPSNGSTTPPISLTSQTLTRSFASSRRLRSDPDLSKSSSSLEQNAHPIDAQEPATSTDTATANASSTSATPTTASLPWYLQNQYTPKSNRDELDERHRQNIPELPDKPPPLLQTILEYVSITAGLDDLNLLDLRHLDPPPALGPKLIMIVGTARSEKHLHVSADRFCRWLRREHGLRANAAGLLGRNELKIKLRRKMKRMKMLANVGGREPEGNIDDGIRTGWICCTIGKIEAHPEDTEMPGDDVDNFVGFREMKPGVNVVVQMFTEEKRDEIDLETLWGGVVRTHDRKNAEAEEKLVDLDDVESEEDAAEETSPHISRPATLRVPSDPFPGQGENGSHWKRPLRTKSDAFPEFSNQNSARQIRRLHTVGISPGIL